jgi:restriction endonuclease S subunit
MYKLSDIASIHSGKLFKNGVKDEKEGTPVVQIRDVTEGKSINWEQVARVKLDRAPRHCLKNGDVVFLTKGIENHAVVIEGLEEEAIATSHFFYIRPGERVDSHFLALQLNSRRSKSYFRSCYKSGRKKHITKADLADMPISLPLISKQKGIVELENELSFQNQNLKHVIDANDMLLEALLGEIDIDTASEGLVTALEECSQKLFTPERLLAFLNKLMLEPVKGSTRSSPRI